MHEDKVNISKDMPLTDIHLTSIFDASGRSFQELMEEALLYSIKNSLIFTP